MNKLQDDMIDIKTIERIMKRTDRVMLPEPSTAQLVWWWLPTITIAAAVIVGLMLYALSYDIAAHVVQEVGL